MSKLKLVNKNMIPELKALLKQISEFKSIHQIDPFRNQKYREILISDILKNHDKTYELKSDKVDFITSKIKNGEAKSCKAKLLKNGLFSLSKSVFEFDKQNDPVRRENTLKYDGFSFGIFNGSNESEILALIFINEEKGINYINSLIQKKQNEFIQKMEIFKKENKQVSRDSIQIYVKELFDCPNITVFNGDGSLSSIDFLKRKFSQKSESLAA